MQYLAICEDDLLFQFMRNVAAEQREVRYLVPNEKVARAIKRRGGEFLHNVQQLAHRAGGGQPDAVDVPRKIEADIRRPHRRAEAGRQQK